MVEPADLLQLIASESDQIDANLEFWLMGSFAVVVAAYAARESLTRLYRNGLIGLYVLFTLETMIKLWADTESIMYYQQFLEGTGFTVSRPSNGAVIIMRALLYVVGSVGVIYFISHTARESGDGDP